MTHEQGAAGTSPRTDTRARVWMIVAIVAIVLLLVAGYFAFSYKRQVDDWEAAAADAVAAIEAGGIELQDAIESGVAGFEQQISDLESALEQAQTEAGVASGRQAETEQELADTQAELETSQGELEAALAELETTQAELDDANAALEQLGELVLADGTYVGPVLSAGPTRSRRSCSRTARLWRVAEVAEDVTITSGGQEFTLEEFAALLQARTRRTWSWRTGTTRSR